MNANSRTSLFRRLIERFKRYIRDLALRILFRHKRVLKEQLVEEAKDLVGRLAKLINELDERLEKAEKEDEKLVAQYEEEINNECEKMFKEENLT